MAFTGRVVGNEGAKGGFGRELDTSHSLKSLTRLSVHREVTPFLFLVPRLRASMSDTKRRNRQAVRSNDADSRRLSEPLHVRASDKSEVNKMEDTHGISAQS